MLTHWMNQTPKRFRRHNALAKYNDQLLSDARIKSVKTRMFNLRDADAK